MRRAAPRSTRGAALAVLLAVALLAPGCLAAAPARAHPPLPIGDLLLVGFSGTTVEGNEEVQHLVCHLKVGGLILFERDVATRAPRNILSPEQVARLTGDLQALARGCAGRPLLIATDAEGGQVMRLSTRAGYAATPSAQELGDGGDLALTELEARRIGAALREAGINWNLAPVVDVAVNPTNPAVVALGRTFSAEPATVTAHARAFVRGMREAGVVTALKHFPGHGSSRTDSHRGFTDVTDTWNREAELAPYRALVREGLVDAVMTAHVYHRWLDSRLPATLSRAVVGRLLRGRIGWQGVVVSDDLLMAAIVQHYGLEDAALRALRAGVDVLLVSGNAAKTEPRAAERVLAALQRAIDRGKISRRAVEQALARVAALRDRATAPPTP